MRQCKYKKGLPDLYINQILEAICEIEEFTKDLTYEDFSGNKMAIKAVSMNLILIGENVKLLPGEIKQKHRQIPWSRMKSARNFVAHEYPKIEFKDMWETANFELLPIRAQLQKILEEE